MEKEKVENFEKQNGLQNNNTAPKENSGSISLVSATNPEWETEEWAKRSPLAAAILKAHKEIKMLENPALVKQMDVPRTCEHLESGKFPVKWVDQTKLYQCVMLWESRGYTENMIANILGKSPRTIRRYAKEICQADTSYEGGDFKIQFLKTLARRWNARAAYFIHLANDKTAMPEARFQAMRAAHEVDRDLVDAVAKFLKN